ncbi:MAG: hypothetical protein ACYC4U_24630 [Pirellulaceae bacterium]
MPLFETVYDMRVQADVLRRRPYGVIVIEDGRLQAIHVRPWPKVFSSPDLLGANRGFHRRSTGDRCWLYYNQPWQHRSFLALKFLISSRAATFGTVRHALIVLDEIARIKNSNAIVAEVRNLRISNRLLRRWGWASHAPSSRRRHFIKRFYGTYPDPREAWSLMRPGTPPTSD